MRGIYYSVCQSYTIMSMTSIIGKDGTFSTDVPGHNEVHVPGINFEILRRTFIIILKCNFLLFQVVVLTMLSSCWQHGDKQIPTSL